VYIINSDGDVISHVDKTLLSKNISNEEYIRTILDSGTQSGYLVDKLDQKNQLMTYYKSDFSNWIYIGVYPLDNLMVKVKVLRNNIILSLAGLIAAGIILSFLMSRKLYNPVNKLLKEIQVRKGINLKSNENEIALLSRAFDTIAKHEDILHEALENNKRNIRENYLTSLLTGKLQKDYDNNLVEINSSGIYYMCASISVDRYEEFTHKYSPEQRYYFKALIIELCETIINKYMVCAGLVLERDRMALIINTDENNCVKLKEQLKESFHHVQMEISKVLDNSITFAMGGIHEGKEEIAISFQESQEALNLRVIYGHGSVIAWNIIYEEDSKYYYPYLFEKHILNFLTMESADDIEETLNNMILEIRNKEGLSYVNIIQIFNQLIGNIIKYLVDANINIRDVFGENFNLYKRLSEKETLEELKLMLLEICICITNYKKNFINLEQCHVDLILSFLNKNYKNELDISTLAEHVNLSYSYARKIFKEKTGKNIVDYLHTLRIAEAKRLLLQSDMIIADIALNVGYNNIHSFNRCFKKYEGITAGEFRNFKK